MKSISIFLFCFFVLKFDLVRAETSCTTPNGEKAKCIRIDSCKILYDTVLTDDPQVINFLRASKCGFHGIPLVCCGTRASYGSTTTSKPIVRNPNLLPDVDTCGIQDVFKIYNGHDTWPNEYPWTALIRYRNINGMEQFSCGGTLINNRYIITAAHCVSGPILEVVGTPTAVRLGEWNTDTDPDCYSSLNVKTCSDKPVDYEIEEITAHSQYIDSVNKVHDIALIRVNRSVQYTDFIRPVCLPKSTDQVSAGQKLDVVGWGKTERGIYSSIKQKLAVPVVTESQCRSVYRREGFNIRSTQLCAGGEDGKDSCQGDSGGPLLGSKNKVFYLYGIVSFGAECGTAGWPGIYTKVSEYRDWIEGNIY